MAFFTERFKKSFRFGCGDGKIGHHIIPLGLEEHALVQTAAHWGFDLNSLANAKALDAAIHTGNHSVYSQKVGKAMTDIINNFNNNITPQQAKTALDGLVNKIKVWVANNNGVNIDNIIL